MVCGETTVSEPHDLETENAHWLARWSFGSNRIQLGAEIKLLEEVLSAIDHDQVRGDHCISALPQSGNISGYAGKSKSWHHKHSRQAVNSVYRKPTLEGLCPQEQGTGVSAPDVITERDLSLASLGKRDREPRQRDAC
jgi:hypothetical protein